MRLFEGCSMLLLGTVLTTAAPASSVGNHAWNVLEGDWETVIASPRRPWNFVTHFKPERAAWTGTMSVEGLGDFPLRHVRFESPRVQFQFPPELDSLDFDGMLGSGRIEGRVREGGRTTPTRLTRIVPMPAPANRLEAWQQDIDFASARVSEYDRSFSPRTRELFRRALAQLRRDLPRKNDAEILVALSQAVAISGNAHTRLRLDPTRHASFSTELPIRIWWFSDGPYVVRAAPRYQRALRCRVVAINGHDVSGVRDQVASLFAGNDAWARYMVPIYLTSPDVLYGLHLIPDVKGAPVTFQTRQGVRFDLWLRSEAIRRDAMAAESWQEISPVLPTGKPRWATALAAQPGRLPLYLRHPDQPYWFEFRPESGLLYFQFNRSANADEGPTFQQFGDSLLAFAVRHSVRDMVVDLRLNSGGNLEVARTFMRDLAREQAINRRGHLFVITGHCTFSAGLYHAAQLKQFTQATFVGETVGDSLDFWAEGGEIVLPNSRAAIWYSNGFHRYSRTDYPENRPYYEQLRIASLAPDIPVSTSSEDYFSGRDPALEAIEARRPSYGAARPPRAAESAAAGSTDTGRGPRSISRMARPRRLAASPRLIGARRRAGSWRAGSQANDAAGGSSDTRTVPASTPRVVAIERSTNARSAAPAPGAGPRISANTTTWRARIARVNTP
jgi:hypothetical protein